ncbi:MAG: hypothetical protein RXR82_06270 [Nitrososphaeria archaeon]
MHSTRTGGVAFDIFCDENDCEKHLWYFRNFGYRVPDCPFVQKSGLRGYRYSNDLEHITGINTEVVQVINRLIREHGYTVVFAEEGWEDRVCCTRHQDAYHLQHVKEVSE